MGVLDDGWEAERLKKGASGTGSYVRVGADNAGQARVQVSGPDLVGMR